MCQYFSALQACRLCLLKLPRQATTLPPSSLARPARLFTVYSPDRVKQMPSRPKPPPEEEIDEMFVKGTGPGGQKINKTNSAVQLRHRPTGIVVKSQATRSRSQNRAIARSLLAARLDELWNGPVSRTAVVAVAKQKKKANATKKARRKYKKLEVEKDKINSDGEKQGDICAAGPADGLVGDTGKEISRVARETGVRTAAGRMLAFDEQETIGDKKSMMEKQQEDEAGNEAEEEEDREEDQDIQDQNQGVVGESIRH